MGGKTLWGLSTFYEYMYQKASALRSFSGDIPTLGKNRTFAQSIGFISRAHLNI